MALVISRTVTPSQAYFLKETWKSHSERRQGGLPKLITIALVGTAREAEEECARLQPAARDAAIAEALTPCIAFHNADVLGVFLRSVAPDTARALVNLRDPDRFHQTFLHAAAYWGDPAVIRVLVAHGADPAVRDDAGFTPQLTARFNGRPVEGLLSPPAGPAVNEELPVLRVQLSLFCGFPQPLGLPSRYATHRTMAEIMSRGDCPPLPHREALQSAFAAAATPTDGETLFDEVMAGELVIVPTGGRDHLADVFFYTPDGGPKEGALFCGIADRGRIDAQASLRMCIFVADRRKLTKEALQTLVDSSAYDGTKGSEAALEHIYGNLHREIWSTDLQDLAFQREIDAAVALSLPKGQSPLNCTAASAKGALRALLLIMGLTDEARPDPERVAFRTLYFSKAFSTLTRKMLIECYRHVGGDAAHLATATKNLEKRKAKPKLEDLVPFLKSLFVTRLTLEFL